jgi:dTDP-4-amino-4,6-dideoxygalactose transaminase
MQKAYFGLRIEYKGKLPVTERAARQGLALPLYGHIQADVVEKVARAIRRIYNFKAERDSQLWGRSLKQLSETVP